MLLLPAWLTFESATQAAAAFDPRSVTRIVTLLRNAEHEIRARTRARLHRDELLWSVDSSVEGFEPLPEWAAEDHEAQKKMFAAAARLQLGAAIEAAFADLALDTIIPDDVRSCGRSRISDAARVYNDAHLVAIWTSAHASYVAEIQSGVEEPPEPSIFTVPNAASEIDWSDLYQRRWCSRLCSKQALSLLSLLQRSTNPGSRGWDSLLEQSLADSVPLRIVLSGAILVCLTCMHPHLHPALRPPWHARMRVLHVCQHTLATTETRSDFSATAYATKEVIRRLLCGSVAASPAMHAALAKVSHPVGHLTSPPVSLPAKGMEAAMIAFAVAGQRLADPEFKGPYREAVSDAFAKQQSKEQLAMKWQVSWLGKGTASVHQQIPLVSIGSELWSVAFRAHFLLFWAHSMVHQMRCSRLDSAQHRAIHSLNSATKLVAALPERVVLEVQRAALRNCSSGILTLEQVAAELGIPGVRGTSSNGGAKGPADALWAITSAGAEPAARLLAYARVAWLCEEVVIVELGKKTTGLQVQALHRRLRHPDAEKLLLERPEDVAARGEEAWAHLPQHSTQLFSCAECKRVATAVATDGGTVTSSFNEIGVSCSMTCNESGTRAGMSHIRCAKRSSAALRTALQFEEDMCQLCVENLPSTSDQVERVLKPPRVVSTSADSGVAARIRRDAKNALEQKASAVACGDLPMIRIPLVGRAIRLWGDWFALCSFCGAGIRVYPSNRSGVEICCLRCDFKLLNKTQSDQPHQSGTVCRFCGQTDPERAGTRWKTLKAPLDTSGNNELLPAPLRHVSYCPSHMRPWLAAAHRSIPTRVILSHIALNAKPIFGADQGRSKRNMDLGFELGPVKKRKRSR